MRNIEGGADMNRITEEWQKNRNRSIFTGAIVSAFLGIFVLLGMLASVWVAFAWVPVLALGGYIIISAVRDYRRKMAVWLALPDAVRRSVNALCAEERQTAYYRLLRGYLTPHGILVQDGFLLKAVEIGKDGYTIDDVLVHDAHCQSNFLHQQLAMMDGYDLPLAVGVIRDVDALVYNEEIDKQIEEVRAKKNFSSLRDMILAGETWEVK